MVTASCFSTYQQWRETYSARLESISPLNMLAFFDKASTRFEIRPSMGDAVWNLHPETVRPVRPIISG
jgi:hypothetical protein